MFPVKQEPPERRSLPDEMERLPGGVTVVWFHDRQIVCFTAPNPARSTLQTLFDRVETVLREWPADKPHLNILDFSSGEIASTPYARERAQTVLGLRPELTIMSAFVLPPSLQMRLFQLMSRTVNRPKGEMAVFGNRDDALAWLKEKGGID